MKTTEISFKTGRALIIERDFDDPTIPSPTVKTIVSDKDGNPIMQLDSQGNEVAELIEPMTQADIDEVTAILDKQAAGVLPAAIAAKLEALRAEGTKRIAPVMPGRWDIDRVKLTLQMWSSIGATAKAPTTQFSAAAGIFQAWSDAHDAISAMTDAATVQAYDETAAPAWP